MTQNTGEEVSPGLPNYESANRRVPSNIDDFSSETSSLTLKVKHSDVSTGSGEDVTSPTRKKKVIITGDDILIEYVRRIKHELRKSKEPLPSNLEF